MFVVFRVCVFVFVGVPMYVAVWWYVWKCVYLCQKCLFLMLFAVFVFSCVCFACGHSLGGSSFVGGFWGLFGPFLSVFGVFFTPFRVMFSSVRWRVVVGEVRYLGLSGSSSW